MENGNALFHTLVNLPPTFGGICSQKGVLFSQQILTIHILQKRKKDNDVDVENSSFWMGQGTRKPKNFTAFLINNAYKKHLYEVPLKVWGGLQLHQSCKSALML